MTKVTSLGSPIKRKVKVWRLFCDLYFLIFSLLLWKYKASISLIDKESVLLIHVFLFDPLWAQEHIFFFRSIAWNPNPCFMYSLSNPIIRTSISTHLCHWFDFHSNEQCEFYSLLTMTITISVVLCCRRRRCRRRCRHRYLILNPSHLKAAHIHSEKWRENSVWVLTLWRCV